MSEFCILIRSAAETDPKVSDASLTSEISKTAKAINAYKLPEENEKSELHEGKQYKKSLKKLMLSLFKTISKKIVKINKEYSVKADIESIKLGFKDEGLITAYIISSDELFKTEDIKKKVKKVKEEKFEFNTIPVYMILQKAMSEYESSKNQSTLLYTNTCRIHGLMSLQNVMPKNADIIKTKEFPYLPEFICDYPFNGAMLFRALAGDIIKMESDTCNKSLKSEKSNKSYKSYKSYKSDKKNHVYRKRTCSNQPELEIAIADCGNPNLNAAVINSILPFARFVTILRSFSTGAETKSAKTGYCLNEANFTQNYDEILENWGMTTGVAYDPDKCLNLAKILVVPDISALWGIKAISYFTGTVIDCSYTAEAKKFISENARIISGIKIDFPEAMAVCNRYDINRFGLAEAFLFHKIFKGRLLTSKLKEIYMVRGYESIDYTANLRKEFFDAGFKIVGLE